MKQLLTTISICLFFILPYAVYAQVWQKVGDMPIPVKGGQAVVHGDEIFIVGGSTESQRTPTKLIQAYNPARQSWRMLTQMQVARHALVAAVYGDSLLICGGVSSDRDAARTLEIWDFKSAPGSGAENKNFDRFYASGTVIGSSLYLIGGYPYYHDEALTPLPYIFSFELTKRAEGLSEQLSLDAVMPYQQMIATRNEIIYLFGGVISNISNKIYTFDTRNRIFQQNSLTLTKGRAAGQAVYVPDMDAFYLIGGYNEKSHALSSVEIVHADTAHPWTEPGPALITGRTEPMAVWFRGDLYVFGGQDGTGTINKSIEKLVPAAPTAVDDGAGKNPSGFILYQNHPNPFNQQTTIPFSLERQSHIHLRIFDARGALVAVLAKAAHTPGRHEVQWDGRDQNGQVMPSGVYFYQLQTKEYSQTHKLLLVR